MKLQLILILKNKIDLILDFFQIPLQDKNKRNLIKKVVIKEGRLWEKYKMIINKHRTIFLDLLQVIIRKLKNTIGMILFLKNIKELLVKMKNNSKMVEKLELLNVKDQWFNIMIMISLL